jgi:LuxR family transcriptional regulator, maltose regulon positive regulatory protein
VAAEAVSVLIDTNLNPPVLRDAVHRPRLIEALAGSTERVKLIRAPAGWGKSTLVASWSRSPDEERPFAWLALDDTEDEPIRFWTYVMESLRSLDPRIGATSMPLLLAPGTDIREQVLPALLNEVSELPESAVLALDDYHRLTSADVHAQVALFIERLPPALQISLTTRSEPPLPLARWRARGELLEIELANLRFDPGEAGELLNGILDLELDADQVARLCERTEGWAAGLFLAALSLRGVDDRGSFVERFAGDDRNVVDYLGAEVLAAQPQSVREALVRSAILDRFCAPLLAAVTDARDGTSLLREIERANLFLIPLDSKREWYRYHHLFQQLLQLELRVTKRELEPELHRCAADWYLEAGLAPEAIRHTIAAGDTDQAAELIAQHWAPALLGAAGDRMVDSWLTALGDEAVAADIRLCFARCFMGLSFGDMDSVAKWLAIAEQAPLPAPFREGLTSAEGALAVVRTAYLWERGDVRGALSSGREALEAEGEGSPWRGIGAATIGLASGALGDLDEARRWSLEYARVGRAFGQHLNETSGLGNAALFAAEAGDWAVAEELARRSMAISFEHGINEHWSGAACHLALGLVLEQQGQHEEAELQIERAAELDRRGAGPIELGWSLLHLSRLQDEHNDRAAAWGSLDEAVEQLSSAQDPGPVLERVVEARRRMTAPARHVAAGETLSERELDVLRLLATPMTQREIGSELYLSLNTVKTHAKNIFRKLEVTNRQEAIARARELGIL